MSQPQMNNEENLFEGFIVAPSTPKKKWAFSDFELLHKLGGGMYGEVYLAAVKGSNFTCAIKALKLEKLVKHDVVNQLRREIEIAFNTRHKYLLRTFTYFYDAESVYLVLEPCAKGMLYSELNRVKKFPVETAARYVAQLTEALLYLHQHHILHRDIKPENILLDHNDNIKLADFGWSVHDPANRRKTACGTPEYFPPEIVEKASYNASADIWCLGIFCFELLVGATPFVDKDQRAICEKIRIMTFTIPPEVPDDARDLIESLLIRDASKRLSLARVLAHPFLQNNYYKKLGITAPTSKRAREPLGDIAPPRPLVR